ncbi:MAG TPA: DUF4157 domain-containing protein [Kofleriaceae bacterium]|nr:DUF4157 domain-containing protein [Kofleriaceae bacterium]
MKSQRGHGHDKPGSAASVTQAAMAPGKRTLTEGIDAGPSDERHSKIEAASSAGAGQPLPGGLQQKFSHALGADVSGVRVHAGGPSAAAAESVQAQAYTTGQDIHFGAGKYDPSSKAGEHLLAHEVVHTVQQRGVEGAAHQAKLEVGEPGNAAEREADALATIAVEGRGSASVNERPAAGAHVVQRSPGPDASVGNPAPTDQAVKPSGDKADGGAAAPAGPAGPVVRAGIDLTAIGQDQGIRVAVGYYSSATDIAANAASYKSHKLKEVLTWGNVKPAGDHPLIKKVVAQIAAGISNPELNTTTADADAIANGVAGNNTEFGRRATIHGTQRKTIGGTAGALVVGKHIAFDESSGKPIEAIQAVSAAIGSLAPSAAPGATPTPGAGATPSPGATGAPAATAAPAANIAEVAFFTHGISTNIGLGKDGWMSGPSVAAKLGAYATPSVQVLVYGCSAAGGKDSFAETLATALAKAGHKARVFGHTSAGPATVNADGREFTAESDGAGGAKVSNATDYEMVFTSDFQTAEMGPVAGDLAIDLTKGSMYDGWSSNQYAVFALIGKVSKTWLSGGLSKVVASGGLAGANDDGSKSSEEAAYTLGISKDPTVAALRKEWQAYRSSAAGKADLTKHLPAKGIAK